MRDFTTWAAEHGHCDQFTVPGPERHTGTATDPDQRWALLTRLLHDDRLDVVDRVAGCLVLLFGQQQSRIAVMTTNQVSHRDGEVFVRFSRHDLPVPEPLGALLLQLLADGKSHTGIGSPPQTRWLFPAACPDDPSPHPGWPTDCEHSASPPKPLAGRPSSTWPPNSPPPCSPTPSTCTPPPQRNGCTTAGGDWTRYAAELARTRNHQPCE